MEEVVTGYEEISEKESWEPLITRRANLYIEESFDEEALKKYIAMQVEKKLQERIVELQGIRIISNEMAKEEIINYIKDKKAMGEKTINDLDIVEALNLPIEQVELILKSLERRE